jgi:hypothetical protein
MLEARLHAAPEPAAVRLAHARTGGNPLLVGDLITALLNISARTQLAERL